MMRFSRFLASTLAAVVLAAAPLGALAQDLMVSAAASLTNALNQLGPKFEASRPGVTLRFNFASSGVLLQQIVRGAPVDVFVSADQATVNKGIEQRLLDADTAQVFARNTLVLIAPAQSAVALQALPDLAGPGVRRIAVGNPASVPVGRYTREVLEAAQLWSVLEPRFVFGSNVRQVLSYVSRGEVEAGFVYKTDAAIEGERVRVVQTLGGHTPITYPAVVVSSSRQKAVARDFIAFLLSPAAQQVLASHGFDQP